VPWLPDDFVHPVRVDLADGYHLRPIRAADVDLDYPAVMGSRDRLWSIYGEAWGWPPGTMTYEQDLEDLARHEAEIEAHQSFNYALFNADDAALFGCVYIDPPEKTGADAEVCWWVIDQYAGTELERALDEFVPRWIGDSWPFERPRCRPGSELAGLARAPRSHLNSPLGWLIGRTRSPACRGGLRPRSALPSRDLERRRTASPATMAPPPSPRGHDAAAHQ
jgi:hypothetical protein